MPIIKSAIKRAKQALVHRDRNQSTKKDIKAAVKAFQAQPTAVALSKAHSTIDKAVKKNVLNARTAARRKASLSKVAKDAGVTLVPATKKPTKPAAAKKPSTTKKVAAKKPVAKKTAPKATPRAAAKK